MKLGDFLATKRRFLGVTQKQLADKLGTSVTYVSSIENGIAKLSPEKIIDYCEALNFNKSNLRKVWNLIIKEELERIDQKYINFKKYLES